MQAVPNHRAIIVKDLRVNLTKLTADKPAQQQQLQLAGYLKLKLVLEMRVAPDEGAAVLRCDEAPAMKLYGGGPRKLELVQGEEVKALLDVVLEELGPDGDEDEVLEELGPDGDEDEDDDEVEVELGLKDRDAPMVRCR